MTAFFQADLRRLSSLRPPVLLLGGINLVRALGLARIPAIVASADPLAPAMASRYCMGRCELPPLAQREAVIERLLRAGNLLHDALGVRVPLFYGDDDHLGLVQDFRAVLSRCFLLTLNNPPIGRALHSKALFQALAQRRGLPLPRRLALEELAAFAQPVLVKPKTKTAWDESAVHRRLFEGAGKARVFESGAAVLKNPFVRQLSDRLQFQEYVPGDDRALWSFHGFATETSELLEWFIGRKIRTHPALTGDSSYLELAHDDELAALGREVVARIPLKGVFKIDFKRSAASGRFYLLEVNARFNLWHYLGAQNGVNLPQVAYDYMTTRARPRHVAARTQYRWLCPGLDYKAYRDLAARGELGAVSWLASLASPKVYDLFSWRDPGPFLSHLCRRARTILGRAVRALRWLSTAS